MRKMFAVCFALATGCAATVGTSGVTTLPSDAAATCSTHCKTLGLTLSSVVVMANNVGCVCNAAPPGGAPVACSTAGDAAGGMAAILEEQASEQASQQHPPASHH